MSFLYSQKRPKIPELDITATRAENLKQIHGRSMRTSMIVSGRPHGAHSSMRSTPPLDIPEVTVEMLVGTALVFGFMAAARLLPLPELGRRQRQAALFFGAEAGTFLDLEGKFAAMFDEQTLNDKNEWLKKARLWCAQLRQRD